MSDSLALNCQLLDIFLLLWELEFGYCNGCFISDDYLGTEFWVVPIQEITLLCLVGVRSAIGNRSI